MKILTISKIKNINIHKMFNLSEGYLKPIDWQLYIMSLQKYDFKVCFETSFKFIWEKYSSTVCRL